MRIRRKFDFEAAHHLPRHPGKCREPHGHSFRLRVEVDRPVDPDSGMAIDFADLKRIVQGQVVDRLDHTDLNRLMDNPTAEQIAVWIWNELQPVLEGLVQVELYETERCSVIYRGE